jgi:hypothetical protein
MKNAIKALFVMSLMASSLAYGQATTNSIYIDQVGGNSTIDIRQKGQNNRIGSEQARVSIQGSSMNVDIDQNGNNNNITGKIEQADNVTEDLTLTGDGNTVNYDMGDSGSVSGSSKTVAVTGDSNTLNFNQGTTSSATGATQNITITGDTNTYTSNINADDVVNTVAISGDSNTMTMTQQGHAGKTADVTVTGSSNTLTINQKSTLNVDAVNITHTGNSNTITVNQCNAGGPC